MHTVTIYDQPYLAERLGAHTDCDINYLIACARNGARHFADTCGDLDHDLAEACRAEGLLLLDLELDGGWLAREDGAEPTLFIVWEDEEGGFMRAPLVALLPLAQAQEEL